MVPGFYVLEKRHGNHLVDVWLEQLVFSENKNHENFVWRVWRYFCETLHQQKFPAI